MDNQRAARAESALLGCLICANHSWDDIADLVSEVDFTSAANRTVFANIAALAANDEPFDVVTLADRMDANGSLVSIDGLPTLSLLMEGFTTAANVKSYAGIIREQSVLRQVARVADEAATSAREAHDGASEILEAAQRRFGEIAEQAQRGAGAIGMQAMIATAIANLEERYSRKGAIAGVSTGYPDLDKMTSGLCAGDMVIIAGRPSMGKTAFALNIAENVAIDQGKPVAFFSLEMSAESLGQRMIASRARVDLVKLRTADLDDAEWARVTAATGSMRKAPLLVDDAAALTMIDIAARARRMSRTAGGLSLIVVDYLQLINSKGKTENRNVEIMKVSQDLKALAKTLRVPVVALSQLSRGVESRPSKRPMMSDLRDSGGIEQDADLVMLMYRDDYYNSDSPEAGTAEIIIAKHRNGPTGSVRAAFNGACCRFDPLAHGWEPRQSEKKQRRPKSMEY